MNKMRIYFNKPNLFFILLICLVTFVHNIMISIFENEPIAVMDLIIQITAGFIIASIFGICINTIPKFHKPLLVFKTGFLYWFKYTFLLGSIWGFVLATSFLCLMTFAFWIEFDSISLVLYTYALSFGGGIFFSNCLYIINRIFKYITEKQKEKT